MYSEVHTEILAGSHSNANPREPLRRSQLDRHPRGGNLNAIFLRVVSNLQVAVFERS